MSRLKRTMCNAVIGTLIGGFIGYMIDSGESSTVILMAILCMGVPFGWSAINRWFGTLLIVPSFWMIVIVWVKFILAIMIGWLLMLIEIVCAIYELIAEKKNIRK